MDIYEYLKMDHAKVAHLFKLFEDSSLTVRQKEIVALITQELLAHALSEEKTFYKALAEQEKTHAYIQHSNKEHQEVEEQINKINHMAIGKNWVNAVLKLKEMVEHHVREEEHKIFKQAKKVFSNEEALVLKERMHYFKGIFLTQYTTEVKQEKNAKSVKKASSKLQAKKPLRTPKGGHHISAHH